MTRPRTDSPVEFYRCQCHVPWRHSLPFGFNAFFRKQDGSPLDSTHGVLLHHIAAMSQLIVGCVEIMLSDLHGTPALKGHLSYSHCTLSRPSFIILEQCTRAVASTRTQIFREEGQKPEDVECA